MSKPYFAKWLPVEGEIKEGDTIISNGRVIPIPKTSEGVAKLANKYPKEHQKVKLFLCSRDIQVGDNVFHTEGKGIVEKIIEDRARIGYGGSKPVYTTVEELYKIIGEISPDALNYVKEGDEFDEEEVEMYYAGKDGHPCLPTHWGAELMKTRPDMGVHCAFKVKGPCGWFH